MAWTDKNGSRWLFGGLGFEVTPCQYGLAYLVTERHVGSGQLSPSSGQMMAGGCRADGVPAQCTDCHKRCCQQLFGRRKLPLPTLKNLGASYGTLASGTMRLTLPPPAPPVPGLDPRWGGITWTDSTGNLWMFGGQGCGWGGRLFTSQRSLGVRHHFWSMFFRYDNGTGIFTKCQWIREGEARARESVNNQHFPRRTLGRG